MLQMINHGISTGALFLLVGILYERRHTRKIQEFGGLAHVMPIYAALFAITMFSSIGLPGLNGFVGEFLILLGAFQKELWYAAVAVSGIVLGAGYMLWLLKRLFYGPEVAKWKGHLWDATLTERVVGAVLSVLILAYGVYPIWLTHYYQRVGDRITASVVNRIQISMEKNGKSPVPVAITDDGKKL
jgi:NADH-quinone oxidoreductase subunit M